MGWHWAELDFTNQLAFFNNQAASEKNQLLAMFDLIATDATMLTALQEEDWWTFAYHYNGSGQPELYAGWLHERNDTAAAILDSLT